VSPLIRLTPMEPSIKKFRSILSNVWKVALTPRGKAGLVDKERIYRCQRHRERVGLRPLTWKIDKDYV
jgi:hypothetical protein